MPKILWCGLLAGGLDTVALLYGCGSVLSESRRDGRWMYGSFIFVPALLGYPLYGLYMESEDHTPLEFKEYEHIRIRNKPYRWGNGDQSFLHNPYVNATTEGYEKDYSEIHH